MVSTPTRLAAFAALASAVTLHSAMAASLDTLPVTPVGEFVALDRRHPAYGGKLAPDAPHPIIKEDASTTADGPGTVLGVGLRQLEAVSTNEDINRFEVFFETKMERNFKVLNATLNTGAMDKVPWPGNYWASFADGLNNRWKGEDEPSAVEKYAAAFGKDAKQLADAVSKASGVNQYKSTACSSKADCSGGNECGKRRGEATGYCMPAWYGICHAWAAASIMEPEPRCAVTKNGVTFYPYDIKGLLTQYYEGGDLPTVYSGTRFDGPNTPVKLDEFYRYADPTRRDIGPGFFHIALTNVIGRFQHGFSIDVDNTDAVWNQPVRSYEVQKAVLVDANNFSGNQWYVSTYPFNIRMKYLVQVRLKVDWIDEAYVDGELVGTGRVNEFTRSKVYEYVLELDSNYDIIGGEWINDSIQDHPDQLWIPVRTPRSYEVSTTGFAYSDIQELLKESVACSTSAPVTPEPTTPEPTTATPEPTSGKPTSTPEPSSGKPTSTPEPSSGKPTSTPEPSSGKPTSTPEPSSGKPTSTPEPSSGKPTSTPEPSSGKPTSTPEPSSGKPTSTPEPSSGKPTSTPEPSSGKPTSTPEPSSGKPTSTPEPSSGKPTSTPEPSSGKPTSTPEPSSGKPTSTPEPSSGQPTSTPEPSSGKPTSTPEPSSGKPTSTPEPSSGKPTSTPEPSSGKPTSTPEPSSGKPTSTPEPSSGKPTSTPEPSSGKPTSTPEPSSGKPTSTPEPSSGKPTSTPEPSSGKPTSTPEPSSGKPTSTPEPSTPLPTTPVVTTPAPTTAEPTKPVPTTAEPTKLVPTTAEPTKPVPTTAEPTKPVPTTQAPPVSGGPCGSDKEGAQQCPEGDYCQPWNPHYYQCRRIDTAKCGKQEVGVDFYGDDIATVDALLPEVCCDKCRETKGCKAYTFVNYNADGKPRCYLKSGVGKKQALVGAVSAVVSAPVCSVPSGGQCGSDRDGVSCCPSGEYCQPWNPSYYQCRPAPQQCAAQEVGVDYAGDDIKTIESILPWECCDRCAETYGCKAYTFVNYNSNGKSACYLKTGTGKKVAKVGAVSSTVLNPKQTKCALSLNTDFYGSDLRTELGLSVDQCCEKCHETKDCKAFTHVVEKDRIACYLKTAASGNTYYWGATSGVAN